MAQAYADQCIFAHNANRVSQANNLLSQPLGSVGENLAATSASGTDYIALIDAWYNEVSDYTYSNTATCASVCGHYTQVIHWTSTNSLNIQ